MPVSWCCYYAVLLWEVGGEWLEERYMGLLCAFRCNRLWICNFQMKKLKSDPFWSPALLPAWSKPLSSLAWVSATASEWASTRSCSLVSGEQLLGSSLFCECKWRPAKWGKQRPSSHSWLWQGSSPVASCWQAREAEEWEKGSWWPGGAVSGLTRSQAPYMIG